jgi:hypothetical protein
MARRYTPLPKDRERSGMGAVERRVLETRDLPVEIPFPVI